MVTEPLKNYFEFPPPLEMENLYKIVKIEGKVFTSSIIALQDIEIGTLILREEFQCCPSLSYRATIIESFLSMSKINQEEYRLVNIFCEIMTTLKKYYI